MLKPLKTVVFGFGHIGKRHSAIVHKHPGFELSAIVDPETEKLEEARKIYPGISLYRSEQDYIKEGSAVIGAVCSPNGLHAQHAQLLLASGAHVICEKPMDLSSLACKKVIDLSNKMAKQVFCVMQNRYSPPANLLEDLIKNNRLGKIQMVALNCYWNRNDQYYEQSAWRGSLAMDGGPLFTQFSHFVDILFWLFGDVKDIQAKFKNFKHQNNTEFEDSGMVHLEMESGALASIQYSTAVYESNMESSITVIGSLGSIRIGGQYMDQLEFCKVKDFETPSLKASEPPNDYGAYKGSAANHHYVYQNVWDTLNGNAKATTNASDGLKVVEIIERIYSCRK